MRVCIYASIKEQSIIIKNQLMQKFSEVGITVVDDINECEYVVTIGGDGTFLSAFHKFKHRVDDIQFIGIHTGHLGFYTDWQAYELDELISGMLQCGNKQPVTYPLLEVEVEDITGQMYYLLALNECTIRANSGTMVSDVYIKDEFFETLRGDGLCVATPTGSTGLNKSLGGAVIHPRLDALQLTEMASLNNRVYRSLGSPLIIAPNESLRIDPSIHGRDAHLILGYDNQTFSANKIVSLQLKISPKRIKFANIRHTHFWNRVETSFIGRKDQAH